MDKDVRPQMYHITKVTASLQDNANEAPLKPDGHVEEISMQVLIHPESQWYKDVGEGFGKVLM